MLYILFVIDIFIIIGETRTSIEFVKITEPDTTVFISQTDEIQWVNMQVDPQISYNQIMTAVQSARVDVCTRAHDTEQS